MSIFKQYFELTEKHRREYGDNTIILMQIGGFYEMYGLHDKNNTYLDNYSKFYNICLHSGLKMTDKEIGDKNFDHTLAMAGFRIYSLEKYLKLFIEAGYACVVYDQDEQKSGTTRSIQAIYTPGTYFDNEDATISNTILSCWIHKFKNTLIVGASCINIMTGKSFIYEYERLYEISPETFDELERFISTFSPNEIIIVHNIKNISGASLVDLCNISSTVRTRVIDLNDGGDDVQTKRASNCSKQIYQDEIFTRFFGTSLTQQTTDLFDHYAIATQSYCFLLDYVHRNNPYLISSIETPVFENQSRRIVLGNHSLKQLNIIRQSSSSSSSSSSSESSRSTRYASAYVEPYSSKTREPKKRFHSICDLLNYCKTSMGTRLFHYTMTHPHSDSVLLNKIYDTTHFCKKEMADDFKEVVHSLAHMFDVEKIIRKIYINRVNYDDIGRLYATLREADKIIVLFGKETGNKKRIAKYLKMICGLSLESVERLVKEQIVFFNEHFASTLLSLNDAVASAAAGGDNLNIFKMDVYSDHDDVVIQYYTSLYRLRIIHGYLNETLKTAEKNKSKSGKSKAYKREPVKLNETERGNISFELTSSRATVLSDYISREAKKRKDQDHICISSGVNSELHRAVLAEKCIPEYLLKHDAFKKQCFVPIHIEPTFTFERAASAGQKSLCCPAITKVLKNTQLYKDELENSVKTHFSRFIVDFKGLVGQYDSLVKFCSHIDMLNCYVTVANTTNYCRPVISAQDGDGFCEFDGLRHPLIEQLLDNEIYVANSITLKDSDDSSFNHAQGFLLYGTNTVGKSSFIKSIGVATVMAQCGFYVAAESMTFKPFRSIYTRILGNDDLFRGLSTFNVEMIELKNILNYADEHSLVLGDEVCSGTEMGSASSIFMGALEHLYNKKTKYIFATHFHNISECDEMKSLEQMKNIHLGVRYDKEHDKLLYDRKLKEGAGENMYGLEVCKYLHLPDDFIQRAHELRNKYFSSHTSLLDLKPSKYNAKKLVGNCEKCGKRGTEVHHLQYQRNSDEKGFIKNKSLHHYFHKNKKANLMVLCDACHDKLHRDSHHGHYRVSDTVASVSVNEDGSIS